MTPMKVENVRAVLIGLLCLLVAGCRTTTPPPASAPKADVKVVESDGTRAVNARTSQRLRLEARCREGILCYNAGKVEESKGILREVSDAVAQEQVELTPVLAAQMKAILTGAPTAKPAAEPAPAARPRAETIALMGEPKDDPKPALPPVSEVRLPMLKDPALADKSISVDFNQVDIRLVIKTISDVTGLNFLVDENVRGTVTLISPTNIKLGEVYAVLESILDVKGFAAVPSGNVIKIMPRAEAVKRNVSTRVGCDPAAIPQGDTIITQIIPLRYANAGEVGGLIAPLLLAGGHVAAYPQTNAIVFTDIASNIHRIVEIIQRLDLPGQAEELTVIPLRHASANEVCQQVVQILQKDGAPSAKDAAPVAVGRPGLKVLADARTNSLIVVCSARLTAGVKDLVARMDVERTLDAANIHVVYLENAEAKEAAKALTAALEAASGKGAGASKTDPIRVTADDSTNSLILIASPEDFRAMEAIIRKLDVLREQVLVEMRIIEASEDLLRDIGVDWATLDQAVSGSVRGFGLTNFGLRVEAASGELEGLGIGAFKKVNDQVQIGAILKALEKTTGVNILSTPHVVTSNHHKATIIVAENIPYVRESRITDVEPSAPTVIKTFDYKDVGVILSITPHISQLGLVRLEIESTFSKLIQSAQGLSADTPTTAKREAKTMVTIVSGSTLVLGGLIRDDEVATVQKAPLLGDIPGVGFLFQRTTRQKQKTNLLLFITPHVLTTQADIDLVTQAREAEAKKALSREPK